MRVLLLEDAPDVAEAIIERFRQRGDVVDHVATLRSAYDFISVQEYDVAILDIGLPDGEGTEVLKSLRARQVPTPVLMLTARTQVDDRVSALDSGADDYLGKPFDLRELEARVRALHRRGMGELTGVLEFENLTLDTAGGVARIGGEPVTLTRREISLLEILMNNRGRVVPKDKIYDRMFAFGDEPSSLNAVEIQIGRLRKKLDGSGTAIKTLRGLGYQLVAAG
ncbi:response regulator transcription factor [Tropicimonas sediminicola]|uniref:Two-component system, OmpR family, response regulator TctD n=1 Tax=Tropicimonas sediminicola TaxID=1031541 RepID=A0A239D0B4_9RHOB|nr:response regulator transcription factor [Tropicimonas sediminicola]SNS25757.1 two-component system, OmpR family, response regulator TctD [Tropicimonas sediminicola]